MKQWKRGRIRTPNLVEVGYLLKNGHRVVDVAIEAAPPYGVAELIVTLEGDGIEIDRRLYLQGHTGMHAQTMRTVCEKVMGVLAWREENPDARSFLGREETSGDRSSLRCGTTPL